MRRRVLVPALVGTLLVLAGCGTDPGTPASAPDAAGPSMSATLADDPREALEQVRSGVRDAGTVRLAVGNLNPPPTTFLQQDYTAPDGDLELSVELAPDQPVLTLRRVDGRLLLSQDGGELEPVPTPEIGDDDTSLIGRVLRTSPAEELNVLLTDPAQVDVAPDLVDEVGGAAAAYRILVAVDDLAPAQRDAFSSVPWQGLPDRLPVTLWVGADGLPLRLEAKYAEPLDGIEGTGTVRIDYSAWGEPIEFDAP